MRWFFCLYNLGDKLQKQAIAEITIDETKRKELLEAAIIELLQEAKEEF